MALQLENRLSDASDDLLAGGPRNPDRRLGFANLLGMSVDVEQCGADAAAWAMSFLGATAYATRCLAFVEDAIERANGLEVFGGDDAAESARMYGAEANSGPPPAGALAFYSSVGELFGDRRDWGHVGLSLGGGQVVHAWDRVRIDEYRDLESLTPASGWEPLRWVGWVPLDRVLVGSRPRDWEGDDPTASAARMQAERFGTP